MYTKRIIPCLDVHAGRVVKGVNFVDLRDAGDPVEIAAAYDAAGADELVFLDITASSDARSTVVDMVRKVAEKVFIPFTVGGGICCVGQFLRIEFEALFGLSGDELAAAVSMALIFLGCLLTGLGVYDRIGKAAGAGSIVPITGFANSVASPALEFKSEGLVTGLAAKMFTVAGPIIVYGVVAGAAVGLIYYFL